MQEILHELWYDFDSQVVSIMQGPKNANINLTSVSSNPYHNYYNEPRTIRLAIIWASTFNVIQISGLSIVARRKDLLPFKKCRGGTLKYPKP